MRRQVEKMKELYQDRNSSYCYKNSNVLINRLNIKDEKVLQKYEAKITAAKLLSLRQKGVTGNFDIQHLIAIHTYLFEDIYSFAGKFRTEDISKGVFSFAHWEYIYAELERLLQELKLEGYLQGLDKRKSSQRLAYYMAELNVLHPFREGNGRTIREFIRQLALQNQYILNLTKVSPTQMLEASKKSVIDTKDLEDMIEKCLEPIRQ